MLQINHHLSSANCFSTTAQCLCPRYEAPSRELILLGAMLLWPYCFWCQCLNGFCKLCTMSLVLLHRHQMGSGCGGINAAWASWSRDCPDAAFPSADSCCCPVPAVPCLTGSKNLPGQKYPLFTNNPTFQCWAPREISCFTTVSKLDAPLHGNVFQLSKVNKQDATGICTKS